MSAISQLTRSNAEWLSRDGQVWAAWTIFNPNGPTLCCVGVSKGPENLRGRSYEVFFRWMHMLGGASYQLGIVQEEQPDPGKQFRSILLDAFATTAFPGKGARTMVTAIPSCVSLKNMPAEVTDVPRDLFKHAPLIRMGDWGRERYLLLKHRLDLFARAGEEAREGYEMQRQKPENQSGSGAEWLRLMWARYAGIPS